MDENTVKIIISKNPISDRLEINTLDSLVSDEDQLIINKKVIEEFIPLFWKLRNAKGGFKFCRYLEYAWSAAFGEVESAFICTFYLLLFILMFLVGIQHQIMENTECTAAPQLSVYLIESGLLGTAVNTINLAFFMCGKGNWIIKQCKHILQGVLFVNTCCGLYHLYSIYKPDVMDQNSEYFCHFNLYWLAFFGLHSSGAVFAIAFTMFLISIVYYFI